MSKHFLPDNIVKFCRGSLQVSTLLIAVVILFSGLGETALAADTTPPSLPANLTATAVSSSQIRLDWTASTDDTGVAGYKIFRSTDGVTFKEVRTAGGTTFIDTGLQANTAYYYKVQAYDAAGNTSGDSNTASATTAAPGTFTVPHGPYIENPAACASCHSSHAAPGFDLLTQSTVTGVCYTCHDGTGSNYNVQALFSSSSGNVSFHPVRDTGNIAINGVIECVSCHNPHGDEDPGNPGSVYPRLLRSNDGTNNYYQGNDFCLACHGTTDQNFTGPADTYWEDTLGDHSNDNAAHYDATKAALQPSSGTEVTCVKCHDKHAGANDWLLLAAGRTLCFNCHDDVSNSMSGKDIKAEYGQPASGSLHDLTGTEPEVRMECTSCHGPHTVGPAPIMDPQPKPYSALSDPDNTKKVFTRDNTATGRVTIGDDLDFCLKCHDGSPPTAVADTNTFVPETIVFPSAPVTINGSGYNKSTYLNSTHHTAVGIHCTDCHESHGSSNYNLWKYPEDTATQSGICLRCHDGTNPDYPGALDIKTEVTKGTNNNYRHPVLDVNAGTNHFNKEDYQDRPLAERHAECTDCHDPHSEEPTPPGTVAPQLPGPLKNISGVGVDYRAGQADEVTWDNYETNPPTFTFKYAVDYQYEICFKCHSYYSYGTNPPTPDGSRTQTDPAKEFNPANPGGHMVIVGDTTGVSPKPGGGYYGAFVGQDRWGNLWNAESFLYCDDCHGSDDPNAPFGPHGSNNKYILKKPYKPTTQSDASDGTGADADSDQHLCFSCHDPAVYMGTDQNYGADQTGFSGGGKNLHNLHSGKKRRSCNACHTMVVHGSRLPHLLVNPDDPYPYNNNSINEFDFDRDKQADPYSQNLINSIKNNAGNWQESDCTHNVCG